MSKQSAGCCWGPYGKPRIDTGGKQGSKALGCPSVSYRGSAGVWGVAEQDKGRRARGSTWDKTVYDTLGAESLRIIFELYLLRIQEDSPLFTTLLYARIVVVLSCDC